MLHHVLFGRPAAIVFVLLLQLVVDASTESVASQYDHFQEQDGAMQITDGGSSPSPSGLARRPHGQEAVLSLSARSSDSECQIVAGTLWWAGKVPCCMEYGAVVCLSSTTNNCHHAAGFTIFLPQTLVAFSTAMMRLCPSRPALPPRMLRGWGFCCDQ